MVDSAAARIGLATLRMATEHIHFVTGRLAERALRRVLSELQSNVAFEWSVSVLPITVAALMTPEWIAKHLVIPSGATRILLPGYCRGDLLPIESLTEVPVERGPRDLRQLPEFFETTACPTNYGEYDIEIIAEINHAPQLSLTEILAEADRLTADGADVIDVGCEPGHVWSGVGDCVRALTEQGHRVSIDSFSDIEIAAATKAGAELVLSVNQSNREAAPDWDCPVVAIGDEPTELSGLLETVEYLGAHNVPFRIDPILEPIGCGFAQSLGRYLEIRRRYPEAEMMMGIGNLTELTDADSAPLNVMLLGFCQELGIRSVLTTQVINWARTSVKECDLARRLVFHAVRDQSPPKHVEPALVMLRDTQLRAPIDLDDLAEQIRDTSIRLFSAGGEFHLLSAGLHLVDSDPFRLFGRLIERSPEISLTHAFYLGFELAKAATAITLGKQYEQDESLDWGFLTTPEAWHRLPRR